MTTPNTPQATAVGAGHTIVSAGVGHQVTQAATWTNPHGVAFTDWTARCGATGRTTGTLPFTPESDIYRKMRCPKCWNPR